jgi:NAD(P)H-hydrate epimerase
MYREALVRAAASQTMDAEAASLWSFNSFALVEAAGRGAARVLLDAYPHLFAAAPAFEGPFAVVLAGTGNNGADAMVILRSLILWGKAPVDNSILLVTKIPGEGEEGPGPELYRSLVKMGVRIFSLSGGENPEFLRRARFIIDGLCGTGLRAPLREAGLAGLLNSRDPRSFLVSVDVPSGLSDDWRPDMPVLRADATLAIEPEKLCLYKPAARSFCGRILHVGGIFPPVLTEKYRGAELVGWDYCRTLIPPVPGDSYKYGRGLVEIRAGAPGSTGAAKIAARGAQAAGAGLVRLLVDPAIHPILAASASAVMVVPDSGDGSGSGSGGGSKGEGGSKGGGSTGGSKGGSKSGDPRFKPDAILLGPGWGRGPERRRSLEEALVLEEEGIPLVLDADAIYLAGDRTFHGNALLTPHPGELAAYSGTSKEELLADPGPLLLSLARERKALILFKSHVLFIASPSGDLAVVDGMRPVLAAGGTGDLLAGFCAGIAARRRALVAERRAEAPLQLRGGDLYACALAGASLLIRSAGDPRMANRFAGPMELADIAADLAGQAWLPGSPAQGG